MRAWRGPSDPPPSSPETLRADSSCRKPPLVNGRLRAAGSPVPREAPDVRETPTGGLVFPVGEEIFSAAGKMMGETCNDIPGSHLKNPIAHERFVTLACWRQSLATTEACQRSCANLSERALN